ncbi:acetate--CoA ligase family protein [Aquisediminimonas sediminicola]|uniref:acetate--CoA ligase family protein n=1 Tax=Alteraquisediminimonas sediminicola TaxID=2676787 RepID=UPI001C8EDE4D|nr:acetate--CoA ligase family protein [Aquisediminimonas sediminicola]
MTVGRDAGLARLFNARSIALVGATERSVWSNTAWSNCTTVGFDGVIHLVNARGGTVYGQTAATSCAAIGAPVDAALLMVPGDALEGAFDDLHAAGIANAIVLSSGFAELGAAGGERQKNLLASARARGIRLMGPNTLGFVNIGGSVSIWTSQLPPVSKGSIAVVSQSGATGSYISAYAAQQGLGLSFLAATGNEADIRIDDVISYLADDEATSCMLVFLESVRNADALAKAADRALAAGKPLIAIKIGTSEHTAKAALAHTGALVGDDRVFDAACRKHGIIRAHSIEEAVATAGLMSQTLPRPGKLTLISISGGICEISADRCDAVGAPLLDFDQDLQASLADILPDFGTPHNPLDVTGAAMLKPELFSQCVEALANSEDVGISVCLFDAPDDHQSGLLNSIIEQVADGAAKGDAPTVLMSVAPRPVSAVTRGITDAHKLPYIGAGLDQGLLAVSNAMHWVERRGQWREAPPAVRPDEKRARPVTEREALAYLDQQHVQVVPIRLAHSADEAVAFARANNGPIAMKVSSPDIAHKTEVGGVALGLEGDEAVAAAYRQMMESVTRLRPDAEVEGVLIAPMRTDGVELFVGVMRDDQWGPTIAVGLGGIWVELLKDTSIRLLPIDKEEARCMLSELRGSGILDGFRGGQAVDRDALAEAIVGIGNAALALGPDLLSLEVNPLLARPEAVEALDALVGWAGCDQAEGVAA